MRLPFLTPLYKFFLFSYILTDIPLKVNKKMSLSVKSLQEVMKNDVYGTHQSFKRRQ